MKSLTNPNPLSFNTSQYEHCELCNTTASVNGNVTLSDLRVSYLGSHNISVVVNDTEGITRTQFIKVVYSKFNISSPYSYFDFIGLTATGTNFQPYGQTNSKPYYNITLLGYEQNANFSMRVNMSTPACLTLKYSNSSVDTKINMSNTSQHIYGNISLPNSKGIWFYADTNKCNASTMRMFHHKLCYAMLCLECVRPYNYLTLGCS